MRFCIRCSFEIVRTIKEGIFNDKGDEFFVLKFSYDEDECRSGNDAVLEIGFSTNPNKIENFYVIWHSQRQKVCPLIKYLHNGSPACRLPQGLHERIIFDFLCSEDRFPLPRDIVEGFIGRLMHEGPKQKPTADAPRCIVQ